MTKKTIDRSAGGFALARSGKSQTRIADELDVSKVTVNDWVNGRKRPTPENRDKMKDLFGIEPGLWDAPYDPPPRAPSPRSPLARVEDDNASTAGGAFAMARALQRQAQAQLDALENEEGYAFDEEGKVVLRWTPAEKAQVTQRLASTVNVLAKITGQYELGRRLMKLPIWKALEKELFDVLKDYPEASRAVAERLERFEARWMAEH